MMNREEKREGKREKQKHNKQHNQHRKARNDVMAQNRRKSNLREVKETSTEREGGREGVLLSMT